MATHQLFIEWNSFARLRNCIKTRLERVSRARTGRFASNKSGSLKELHTELFQVASRKVSVLNARMTSNKIRILLWKWYFHFKVWTSWFHAALFMRPFHVGSPNETFCTPGNLSRLDDLKERVSMAAPESVDNEYSPNIFTALCSMNNWSSTNKAAQISWMPTGNPLIWPSCIQLPCGIRAMNAMNGDSS